jgi:hypothetical protein
MADLQAASTNNKGRDRAYEIITAEDAQNSWIYVPVRPTHSMSNQRAYSATGGTSARNRITLSDGRWVCAHRVSIRRSERLATARADLLRACLSGHSVASWWLSLGLRWLTSWVTGAAAEDRAGPIASWAGPPSPGSACSARDLGRVCASVGGPVCVPSGWRRGPRSADGPSPPAVGSVLAGICDGGGGGPPWSVEPEKALARDRPRAMHSPWE